MLLKLGAGSLSDRAADASGGHAVLAGQLRHAWSAQKPKPLCVAPEAVGLDQAAWTANGAAAEGGAFCSDWAALCLTVHPLVAWKLL